MLAKRLLGTFRQGAGLIHDLCLERNMAIPLTIIRALFYEPPPSWVDHPTSTCSGREGTWVVRGGEMGWDIFLSVPTPVALRGTHRFWG